MRVLRRRPLRICMRLYSNIKTRYGCTDLHARVKWHEPVSFLVDANQGQWLSALSSILAVDPGGRNQSGVLINEKQIDPFDRRIRSVGILCWRVSFISFSALMVFFFSQSKHCS